MGIVWEYYGIYCGGYGVVKVVWKFVGISQIVWFWSIKGVLKMLNVDVYVCNVSEIFCECLCDRMMMIELFKWLGIEQDFFMCIFVDLKVFVVLLVVDFVLNKRSKNKGKSQSDFRD